MIVCPLNDLYQSILIRSIKKCKRHHFKLYRLNTSRYCDLCFDKLKSKSKMQTLKERMDKFSKYLTLSEDMVDDSLMVNGYRLKMVGTY